MAGAVTLPGRKYRVVVVPACESLPLATFKHLLSLAEDGATIIFARQLPRDVPGLGDLEKRRAEFAKLQARLAFTDTADGQLRRAQLGRGQILAGDLAATLALARVPREPMFDQEGLMCLRRTSAGGHFYFIANRSDTRSVDGWIPLARPAKSAAIMDPLTGKTGVAALRPGAAEVAEVLLQLAPGESAILRCEPDKQIAGEPWPYWEAAAASLPLAGKWQAKFLAGGPETPASFSTEQLGSWTSFGDPNAQRFAGTALYTIRFDSPPAKSENWLLDLGRVAQSARVRLNGRDLGTLITAPFRVWVRDLKPKDNVLEVEVTNVSANRIRDLDRRGVKWKNFNDINFVNINYKPFDASNWPLTDSGLLGPVKLSPVRARVATGNSR